MTQELLEAVKEKMPQLSTKWDKKTLSFFDNFVYLNAPVLIEDQIEKLTHLGINSINRSSEMVKDITDQTLDMIDNELKGIITQIGDLSQKFDLLDKTLKQKQGFFSSKTPSQAFFEIFKSSQNEIRQKIKDLNLKEQNLRQIKENLETSIDEMIEVYIWLERDLKVIKMAEEKLANHTNPEVVKIYKSYDFDLTTIKTDLLTHQQIIFQKFAAIKILLKNVFNCHKNISYITQVTHGVIMNIAELQQIISLSQSTVAEKDIQALKQLRDTLTLATTDIKIIAAQPFVAQTR